MTELLTRIETALECIGWFCLILLLPLSLRMDTFIWSISALFIPATVALSMRHGRMGWQLAAVAGLVSFLPGVQFIEGFYYGLNSWIYIVGLIAGYIVLRGANWPNVFPTRMAPGLLILAIALPLTLRVYIGGVSSGLALSNIVFGLVLLWTIGGVPGVQTIGLVVLIATFGALLKWFGVEGEFDYEVRLYSVYYAIWNVGAILTAVIVYWTGSYLVSFSRQAKKSLPGRNLPNHWVRVLIVAGLIFASHSSAMSQALHLAFPGSYVSLETWLFADLMVYVLAGFLLPRVHMIITSLVIAYLQITQGISHGPSIIAGPFLYAWGFGAVGVAWHSHIRGELGPIFPEEWVKFGVLMAGVAFGLFVRFESLAWEIIPTFWCVGMLVGWWAFQPRFGRSLTLNGWRLEVLNILLMGYMVFLFWKDILGLIEAASALLATGFEVEQFSEAPILLLFGLTGLLAAFSSVAMSFIHVLVGAEKKQTKVRSLLSQDRVVFRSETAPARILMAVNKRYVKGTNWLTALRAFGASSLATLPWLIWALYFWASVGFENYNSFEFDTSLDELVIIEDPIVVTESDSTAVDLKSLLGRCNASSDTLANSENTHKFKGLVLHFELDTSDVRPLSEEGMRNFDCLSERLKDPNSLMILIEAHADEEGTREYNLALSARRAAVVRNALVSQGIQDRRIRTVTYGRERPIRECEDAKIDDECRAANRRVDIVINDNDG